MRPHWLFERMRQWPDRVAMIQGDQKATYADLLEMVAEWLAYFEAHDIQPGQTVAVRADFTPQACALLLALMKHAAISVPLTMETEAQHDEYFDVAQVEVVLTHRNGEEWLLQKRDARATYPLIQHLRVEGEPGLIAFSSGSTGKPKAILHNLARFIKTYREQRRSMCTITFLSFDHLGGTNTLVYVLSSGGTAVALSARDPETVCQAIETHGVTLLPTSPTFLNLLLITQAHKRYDLSSLKLITYGTEVMPESTLEQLRITFPNVILKQTYAFSESSGIRVKSKERGSLWIKIGGEGIESKVIDGQLWVKVKGPMMGYLNAPNPFDEAGWINTGDMVEVDGEYVRILGRKSEIINVGGEKVYTAEVENVILQMDMVTDVMVKGKSSPLVGNIVTATVTLNQPQDPKVFRTKLRSFCRTRLPEFKIPVIVRVVEHKLHTARFKKSRMS